MSKASLSDQMRKSIVASGRLRVSICNEVGIDQGLFSRFMAGKSGLSLEVIDRLAAVMGWSLAEQKRPGRKSNYKRKG